MRPKERGPAGKQKPRTVQQRTTRTVPHGRTTAAEAVVYHLLALPFVLAVIVALCALVWAVQS